MLVSRKWTRSPAENVVPKFLLDATLSFNSGLSIANPKSGKILVLEPLAKMYLTYHIARFFKV